MSMRLANAAFADWLGPGMSLIKGTAQCVNGGLQMALTFVVQNPDGTTTNVTQTINPTDDHIRAAGMMANAYRQQMITANKITAPTVTTDPTTVTP